MGIPKVGLAVVSRSRGPGDLGLRQAWQAGRRCARLGVFNFGCPSSGTRIIIYIYIYMYIVISIHAVPLPSESQQVLKLAVSDRH